MCLQLTILTSRSRDLHRLSSHYLQYLHINSKVLQDAARDMPPSAVEDLEVSPQVISDRLQTA